MFCCFLGAFQPTTMQVRHSADFNLRNRRLEVLLRLHVPAFGDHPNGVVIGNHGCVVGSFGLSIMNVAARLASCPGFPSMEPERSMTMDRLKGCLSGSPVFG